MSSPAIIYAVVGTFLVMFILSVRSCVTEDTRMSEDTKRICISHGGTPFEGKCFCASK
jgi:hypothetical protein